MLLNPSTDMGMQVNCGLMIHFTYVDNDASWIFHDAPAHISETPLKVSFPGSLVLETPVVSFADVARLWILYYIPFACCDDDRTVIVSFLVFRAVRTP